MIVTRQTGLQRAPFAIVATALRVEYQRQANIRFRQQRLLDVGTLVSTFELLFARAKSQCRRLNRLRLAGPWG